MIRDRGERLEASARRRRGFSGWREDDNVCVTGIHPTTRIHHNLWKRYRPSYVPNGPGNKNVDENDSIDSSKSTLSARLSRRDERRHDEDEEGVPTQPSHETNAELFMGESVAFIRHRFIPPQPCRLYFEFI